MRYYVMIEEWFYPTESGRDVVADYSEDELDEALKKAASLADAELENFEKVCGDSEWTAKYNNRNGGKSMMNRDETGYMLTTKNGLDKWYYAVRIIPIGPLLAA